MTKKDVQSKAVELDLAGDALKTNVTRQVRLLGIQDDDGYHLCLGFIKEGTPEGDVVFEETGQKMITYAAYEVVIRDLEICLAHAKSLRDAKIAEMKQTEKSI